MTEKDIENLSENLDQQPPESEKTFTSYLIFAQEGESYVINGDVAIKYVTTLTGRDYPTFYFAGDVQRFTFLRENRSQRERNAPLPTGVGGLQTTLDTQKNHTLHIIDNALLGNYKVELSKIFEDQVVLRISSTRQINHLRLPINTDVKHYLEQQLP